MGGKQSCQGLGGEMIMSEILHKDNIKWVLRVLKSEGHSGVRLHSANT